MLVVGTIVTVVDSEFVGHGLQARIVEVDDRKEEPYRLEFGPWADRYFRCLPRGSSDQYWYPEAALHVDDALTVKNEAWEVFGKPGHYHREPREPFDPTRDCMVAGCQAKAERQILWNAWGVMTRYYVCAPCAQTYHGMCGDAFPLKRELEPDSHIRM